MLNPPEKWNNEIKLRIQYGVLFLNHLDMTMPTGVAEESVRPGRRFWFVIFRKEKKFSKNISYATDYAISFSGKNQVISKYKVSLNFFHYTVFINSDATIFYHLNSRVSFYSTGILPSFSKFKFLTKETYCCRM